MKTIELKEKEIDYLLSLIGDDESFDNFVTRFSLKYKLDWSERIGELIEKVTVRLNIMK